MIVVRLEGGLGNQLFNYAFGRFLAEKHHTELKLDISWFKNFQKSHHTVCKLSNFNIIENFATEDETKNLPIVNDTDITSVFIPEFKNTSNNVIISGLFQSEKYFIEIADIIRKEFALKNPLHKNSKFWAEKILRADCAVALHMRLGDYISPNSRQMRGVVYPEYFLECINELKKNYPQITLFIFSDELNWARENLKFDVPTEFVEGCEVDYEELYLMSICKHNIIANSTFAWWSAWLNQNPDKKIFTPYPWHFNGHGGNTLVPEDWIKIPVDYQRYSIFPPFLSIILYIEDNSSIDDFCLSSLLTPYFADYEIIIVSSDKDGIGKIYNFFAGRFNVTFIKAERNTDRHSAWNIGMKNARGDYVIFLTGKDFLFPSTIIFLSKVWEEDFKKNYDNKKKYINTENYHEVGAEIVCLTKTLSENDEGSLTIKNIPNKKFLLHMNAVFKDLPSMIDLKINAVQKMTMLANGQIDNSVGTKFFKRTFLIENNIFFNETAKEYAELLFLTNAFILTDRITLLSEVVYGRMK